MLHRERSEVIVAGAGPVGLVAALILGRAGIQVTLIEKRSGLNRVSKASTFHPPTLEIFSELGILDPVLAEGRAIRAMQYRTPAGTVADFSLSLLSGQTPYPFRIHLDQMRMTPHLLTRLVMLRNVRVMFDTEVETVTQEADRVRVTAVRNGQTFRLDADYLIGSDGAKSRVRDLIGVGFDGAAYPDKIVRIMTNDALDPFLPGLADITYLFSGTQSVSLLRMPDCWRIILRVPDNTSDALALDDAWITSRLAAFVPGWTRLPAIHFRDIYGASRRVASSFMVGRTCLIGDAAHITNTRGGMNMNCGIHDAHALAHAMIRALRERRGDMVISAARLRQRIAHEMLIPRTDLNVTGGPVWLEKLRETAQSGRAATDYLAAASMLDMVERTAKAA